MRPARITRTNARADSTITGVERERCPSGQCRSLSHPLRFVHLRSTLWAVALQRM